MSGIAYINGTYCKADEAKISIYDRGFLFADAVYEVIPVYKGRPFFVDEHLQRLEKNLTETKITKPDLDWPAIFKELIKQNGGGDLQLYLQITRGNQGVRKHDIPDNIQPTVIAYTLHMPYPTFTAKKQGLKAKVIEDVRWLRCDIKTTSLMANILLNNDAVSKGANTAILSRNGFLTEGSANNVFLVDKNDIIWTPPLDNFCLPGITRQIAIELIRSLGWSLREEKIPAEMLFKAQEVWITSTTKEIYPVTCINDTMIGEGYGGTFWSRINEKYQQLIDGQ
ncbi:MULTISPECIES: D-amino acid aminotransferase [unclassified Legionella]|uniref:D-amino acid aminotransferase n=1 Tax=unclassified Legionella TaxID=2622702 RepID=UPI001054AC42|nr:MULTISPECIES: D-amino acid aminotransferase [unclassified Legionella]MDI9818220.1 D-amino acid aminotransferase [Legionella sp. PL877]